MTEQIKRVIENLTAYVEYGSYNEEKIDDDIRVGIRSLTAWSEVLTELERHRRNGTNIIGLNDAIHIINKHLAEVGSRVGSLGML